MFDMLKLGVPYDIKDQYGNHIWEPFLCGREKISYQFIMELAKYGFKTTSEILQQYLYRSRSMDVEGAIKAMLQLGVEITKDVLDAVYEQQNHEITYAVLQAYLRK